VTAQPKAELEGISSGKTIRRKLIIALLAFGMFCGVLALLLLSRDKVGPQFRQAEWQQKPDGAYAIQAGPEKLFNFHGVSNRVAVPDTPAFHFGTNQDFSVEAWIRASPSFSKMARRVAGLWFAYPMLLKLTPRRFAAWVNAHTTDNDFGVTPLVDKHHAPTPFQSVGFQLYLDYGRLACQLSEAPMRQLSFQNFVSPGPNLQDRRWHHVAMAVERSSTNGGRLYVDGCLVLTFDPTRQTGDLSNSEPLRIGNHANPSLRCFYKGVIGDVVLYRRALRADEIAGYYQQGRSK
jgi:Concanavalin A-like lectin/glucanases superfamily